MHVVAQLIGYPRIGPNRELKRALERMWSGRLAADAFAERVDELRRTHLAEQREATGSAVDDFVLYDEVLETALMLGVRPADLDGTSFDLLTALARGTAEREAWEMTKWLAQDVVDRLPNLGAGGAYLKQMMADNLVEHGQYIDEHGEDMPEIRNWKWGNPL